MLTAATRANAPATSEDTSLTSDTDLLVPGPMPDAGSPPKGDCRPCEPMPTAYSVLSGDVLARWAAGVLSADTDAAACGRVVYTMPSRWEGYWRTLATLVCAMGGTMVCVDTATWRVFGSRDMLSALDVVCDSAISGADAARRAAQDDPLWVADWVGSIATACSNIFSIACCGHRVDFNLVMLKRSKISFDLAMSCYPDSKPVRVRDPRSGGSHALVRVLSCPQTHWCQGMSL